MRHVELYVSWAILIVAGMVCTAVIEILIHQTVCVLHAKMPHAVRFLGGVKHQ